MQTLVENSCDAEDEIIAQWYRQMSNFVQRNQNTTQQIVKLNDRFQSLEQKLEQTNQKLEQCLKHRNGHSLNIGTTIQTQANGEIVIQRRMDGSENFERSWLEYKQGFGKETGEFFIGLDILHKITNTQPYELIITMEDWENDRRYARYDRFVIGSEAEKYALKQIGTYSGSAGDSLSGQLGQKFTTKDQDNDNDGGNCAVTYHGAWWYNACHQSNLNGLYRTGTIKEFAIGIHWLSFKGYYYSLKFVEMRIRPT